MKHIKIYEEFINESVNEGSKDEMVKNEVINKLSQFFDVSASALSKFKFDGTDDVRALTKALNGTDYEGIDNIVRVAIKAAKRDLGINESLVTLNEATSSINALKKALPGLKFETAVFKLDPVDDYKTVESFYVNVPGIGGEYGEDNLYINIYDGDEFCFFHDSTPVPTSLHSSSDANKMVQTLTEIPLPLSKLNKKIFDEAVKKVKERI